MEINHFHVQFNVLEVNAFYTPNVNAQISMRKFHSRTGAK